MGIDLNPLDLPKEIADFMATNQSAEQIAAFALKQALGFEPPWSAVQLVFMLNGNIWSAAQQVANLWMRVQSQGINPWNHLGQIIDGIASVGPGGYIRDSLRNFWRPIWHAMEIMDSPTRDVERFIYATQDAIARQMAAMLDAQVSATTHQVINDNQQMQAAMRELNQHYTRTREANSTLHEALYYVIPDAASFAANAIDLIEVIAFILLIIDTDGLALLGAGAVWEAMLSENYVIYNIGIVSGYIAVSVWLVSQNIDFGDLPKQIAAVAAHPPQPFIPLTLLRDQQTLQDRGCSPQTIASFMTNPQITQGYIHEIVAYHAAEACHILAAIDIITTQAPQIGIGGLVSVEQDLRTGGMPFIGALFQIQWLAHYAGTIQGIEIPVKEGNAPDMIAADGTIIDCKSVKIVKWSEYRIVIERYKANFPGQPIKYAFDGNKLIDKQRANVTNLTRLLAEGVQITVVFSLQQAEQNPDFLNTLTGIGVHVELWEHISV